MVFLCCDICNYSCICIETYHKKVTSIKNTYVFRSSYLSVIFHHLKTTRNIYTAIMSREPAWAQPWNKPWNDTPQKRELLKLDSQILNMNLKYFEVRQKLRKKEFRGDTKLEGKRDMFRREVDKLKQKRSRMVIDL